MTVVEFSAARVEPYLMQAVTLFLSDPPTTRWQAVFLRASPLARLPLLRPWRLGRRMALCTAEPRRRALRTARR